MTELLDALLDDEDSKELDASKLGTLARLCNEMTNKQDAIADAEEALKELKQQFRDFNEVAIPELMEQLGFEKITLTDGRQVAVSESIQCSIPAPQRNNAYKWMDNNGHGDLIKTKIVENFDRGEKAQAEKVFDQLSAMGLHPQLSESVHPQTLKAWLRTEMGEGRTPPDDLFKIHVHKVTKVK